MTSVFNKKELTDEEWLVKQALTYHGLKGKIKDDNITKILNNEDNK